MPIVIIVAVLIGIAGAGHGADQQQKRKEEAEAFRLRLQQLELRHTQLVAQLAARLGEKNEQVRKLAAEVMNLRATIESMRKSA
jgi:uncharacterized protein HemX